MITHKKARPNGHRVELVQHSEDGMFCIRVWEVSDDGGNGYWDDHGEYDTLQEAEVAFDAVVKVLARTPNWHAQAEYDAEHGTSNGYDERIEAWRREW